jgi:hypothetical protein
MEFGRWNSERGEQDEARAEFNRHLFLTLVAVVAVVTLLLCLPKPPASAGAALIVYSLSIMQEALGKDIFPYFSAKRKKERGEDVHPFNVFP